MTDEQFIAEVAKISQWLRANKMESVTRHVGRYRPEVVLFRRRPKKSRLTGEMR